MAVCGGCGAETKRFRTKFNPQGDVTGEECDKCTPNTFDPQWLHARGALAYEAYPDKYDKIDMPDGRTCYRAKDEWAQDTADKFKAADKRERKKYEEALEKKRRERRTTPLTPAEIQSALNKWNPIVKAKADEQKEADKRAREEAWGI